MKKDDRKTTDTDDDESVVESVVNDVLPGMGNLVKNLRKKSPELDQKIKEKEREIKKRLEEGYSPEPTVTHSVKIRSLVPPGGHRNGIAGACEWHQFATRLLH